MARDDILVCAQSFVVGHRVVRAGETFREGHPLTAGREGLFRPFTVDNEFEQAVAEKRATRRAQKPAKQEAPTREPEDNQDGSSEPDPED